MILSINDGSPVPPYEQVRSQITSMVRVGALTGGTRLPSIRQLANDLGLAGGTVARAYRELEVDGIVVTRGRHGTIVSSCGPRASAGAAELAEAAADYAERAHRLGVAEGEAEVALRAAFADLATFRRLA